MSRLQMRARPANLPQRTCVGCGCTTAKRELVRLVRIPSGNVEPDPTGKRAGRGAYLCHSPDCWDRAVKKGRLESALRTKLTESDREALLRYATQHLGADA